MPSLQAWRTPDSLRQTDDNITVASRTYRNENSEVPDRYEETLVDNLTAITACGALCCVITVGVCYAITIGICCICAVYVARSCISYIPAASVALINYL